jgi:hypothetical protein
VLSLACRVLLAFAAVVALLPVAGASAQASRTWMSGVGDDANPCSATAPCKTLAGAISKTAAGGEINALSSGGFGTVTITKAITIDLSSVHGGILATGTYGVRVNAAATDDVVLRGLRINGGPGGAQCPGAGGQPGIAVTRARSVRIENTTIERFGVGIQVAPTDADTRTIVDGVDVGNVCAAAVDLAPAAGRSVSALVRDTTLTGAATGLRAGTGAHALVTGSTIFGNALGLSAAGTGLLTDLGGNQVAGNTVDGAFSVPAGGARTEAPVAPAAPVVPAAVAPAAAPVVQAPTASKSPVAAVRCVVPKLGGLKVAQARARLKRAHCAAGKISYRTTRVAKRAGRVAAQRIKAASRRNKDTPVALTVWRRARS